MQVSDDPKLISAFPALAEADKHYGLHSHPFHELVLIQSGRFRSKVGSEEHVAVPGDILFYTAHTAHEEWAEDNNPVTTSACAFEWNGFAPDEPVFRHDSNGQVQKLLAELSSLYIYDEFVKTKRCDTECPQILWALITELDRLKPHGPHAMVDDVRAYIRSHMDQPLSIEELAEHVGFSKRYFAKIYRATTGQTPWHDVQLLRAEEARRLIITTSLPLHQIASKVGIANEYHLSRLLKTILATSVRQLRN